VTSRPLEAVVAVREPAGVAVCVGVLRVPGAARLLAGALLGRAQLGMASLAILLVVHDRTASFAAAGVAVGVFGGVGAAATPVLGRLVDRVGPVPVLAACGFAQSASFVVLALRARHDASYVELVVWATLAGGVLPPLSSCMRGRRSRRSRGYAKRRTRSMRSHRS
jgi:MFS family permease